jgi:hypothetical protein
MRDYLRAVTLGAFTWKDKERIALFFEHIKKTGTAWLLLHFLLLTFCLNFPITLIIARLSPFELYGRLYGENAAEKVMASNEADQAEIDKFNIQMTENGYGRNILLPIIGMCFGLTLIIQAIFFLCAVFFLKLSRINTASLSFHDMWGLAVFSSTLPVIAAVLFGFVIPTVHIIIFYLIVIFFIFQRSNLYSYVKSGRPRIAEALDLQCIEVSNK